MKNFKISFIGAGRVAHSLCNELYKNNYQIQKIISRDENKCRQLVSQTNAYWSSDFSFDENTDLILIAVPDNQIRNVALKIKCPSNTVVAHTAGSVGLDVFPGSLFHTGILYPLQTFSQGREINFNGLPFFIEGNDRTSMSMLSEIAGSLGGSIHFTDSEKRRLIHLSAVFVNNFANYMLTSGKRIADKAGLGFEVLVPLIIETLLKAVENGPEKSQTGPAVRSDTETIKSHIKLLSFSTDLQNIYRVITESIMRSYNKQIDD